jgi:hypothetical protein
MKNIKEKLTYLRFHLVRSISTLLTEWAFPLELSMSSPPPSPSLSYTYTNNPFRCQSERRLRFRTICAINKLNWSTQLETKNLIFDFSVLHILGVSVSDLRSLMKRLIWECYRLNNTSAQNQLSSMAVPDKNLMAQSVGTGLRDLMGQDM